MGLKIPMWQAVLVLVVTVFNLCYCLGVMESLFGSFWACSYGEVHIALLASATFATIVALINKYKWKYIETGMINAITRSMQAILILMLVGALIGVWILSGIVPAMVFYGLSILKPSIFLVASCLICCIVSLSTGSSWTTAGTVGIALIGVGNGLGVPEAMSAGAVISGALFGDKMSPLSDTTNIAPASAGTDLFTHIRHMIYTVTPSLVIALIAYMFLGRKYQGSTDFSHVAELQNGILDQFNISPILLIPPLFVILMVALKLPAIPGMLIGILLGIFSAMTFQGIAIGDIPVVLHYGFGFADEASVPVELVDLFTRGGMDSMMWTINLILCAMCFGGAVDVTGILTTLAEGILKVVKGRAGIVALTIFTSIFVNIITGDQYLAIILPGRMYKESYEDLKLKPKNLSRALEDSGTVTSNLVPWNTCGAYMQSVFGIGQWGAGGYAPYAILCWICPLVSIFYGITGITMEEMTDAEYEKVIENRKKEQAEALEALGA